MTKESLAAMLNGRPMGGEITKEEHRDAKANGFVIVYGHSDDCVEFRGAIHDEAYANEEHEVWVDRDGVKRLDEDDQEVLERHNVMNAFMGKARLITAQFGGNKNGFDWSMSTEIPHANFDILEDGEKFCRGIVFSINDLPA